MKIDVDFDAGGLFAYEGRQVVLYIKDHRGRPDVINDPEKGKRLHFMDCRTLEDMKARGRFERYVATNRRDGLFKIQWSEEYNSPLSEKEVALRPCKNCLKAMNYIGYANCGKQEQNRIFSRFDIEECLNEYSPLFTRMPIHTEDTQSSNDYALDWSRISQGYRSRRNWTCELCTVSLANNDYRKYLHTHHVNGQKGDNRPSNLQALCAVCHKQQDFHDHMHVSSKARRIILRARREQKLK